VPYINKQALVAGSTERLVKCTHVILKMVVLSAFNVSSASRAVRTRLTILRGWHEPVGRPKVVALAARMFEAVPAPIPLHPNTEDTAICGTAALTNLYQIASQSALREKDRLSPPSGDTPSATRRSRTAALISKPPLHRRSRMHALHRHTYIGAARRQAASCRAGPTSTRPKSPSCCPM
jgi:hypothetical protein